MMKLGSMLIWGGRTMPSGKTKPSAGAAKARPVVKATGKRQPAETKLAELKLRLLEISDLTAAGALLGWDQSTYMPRGGAPARARQGATLSKRWLQIQHSASVSTRWRVFMES
jgi:Carboxypeptidase Taq (M32) metallopeptidase